MAETAERRALHPFTLPLSTPSPPLFIFPPITHLWSLWRRLSQIGAFLARPGRVSCWFLASVVTPLRFSQTPCPPRLFDRFGPPLRRVPALSVAAGATTPCPGTQCAALTSRGYTTPTTLTQFIKTNLRLHSKSRPNLESRALSHICASWPSRRAGGGRGGRQRGGREAGAVRTACRREQHTAAAAARARATPSRPSRCRPRRAP